jgi:signal transduction histidine kinase
MLNLGPLVVVLALMAVVVIWLLQGVLGDLNHLDAGALSRGDHLPLLRRFRVLVLVLAVVFVVVINLSVILLIRMSGIVLRPMDKLTEATQQLALGRFDYRVNLEQHDEFGQLAEAFNRLAERLQSDEQRRMETLGQAAVALNHELNNCITIIELQLRLVRRQTTPCPELETRLGQIQQSLTRMSSAVQSLKSVRRIVLTDYMPGMKMLDLKRSSREDDSADDEQPPSGSEAAHEGARNESETHAHSA